MKSKSLCPPVLPEPSENDIREYAYHLFLQGRCEPDHDIDHWLEATACLKANIPAHQSGTRLHQHVNGPAGGGRQTITATAAALAL